MDATAIITLVVNAILVPLLMWGLAELSLYIRAKTAAIKDNEIRIAIEETLSAASDNIRIAVRETAQTYVDTLKKAGTFNEEAQREAFSRSYERAKVLMGEAGLEALEDVIENAEAWITAKIEATVKGGW
jgi:TRAP-type C4-dicarboxylate transport system substrate-binding protein